MVFSKSDNYRYFHRFKVSQMVFLFRYSHIIFVKKIGQETSTTKRFFRANPSYEPEPFFQKTNFSLRFIKNQILILATL